MRSRGSTGLVLVLLLGFCAREARAQSFPTIDILTPTNGTVFPTPANIGITVSANDIDGYISFVEFFSGTNRIGAATQAPFSFIWSNAPPGYHPLSAVAYDNSGRRTYSDYVYVKVGTQARAVSVVRGPYLQMGTPSNVVVRWRTDWLVDSKVSYGTSLNNLTEVAFDGTLKAEHELKLENLLPGTEHSYVIQTSTSTLLQNFDGLVFRTPPLGPGPVRIWVVGDSGTGNSNAVSVRMDYEVFTRGTPTDVWLMLGDNAYEEGTDDQYQSAVFDMYTSLLRRTCVWPTIGNHDATFRGRPGEFPLLDFFTLPSNAEAGGVPSGTEKYYSFDYANVHFVCLDSQSSPRKAGGAMLGWLEQDLAATAQDWIIAYWHHPPYTKGTYDSDTDALFAEMRENALPLLERYGVDLVFCGHSHVYERSFFLNGHYGLSTNLEPSMILNNGYGRENNGGPYEKPAGGLGAGQGTVYTVCGCSGEGGVTRSFNHPAMRVSSGGFGSVVLDVNGLRLDARFLRVPGEVHDYFTIIKGAPRPEVRPQLEIARATNNVRISWPTSLAPFRLGSTSALGTNTQWASVNTAPVQVGRRNVWVAPISPTNRFFELRAD